MMYKILIFITMMAVSTFAFAGISVNTNGLSEEQKAALILQVEDMKKTPPQPGEVIESMKKWAEVGQGLGVGLISLAKELGVAVDQLMNTTVGKIGMAIIVWKMVGASLVGVSFGLTWLMVVIPLWIVMYRRNCYKKTIEYYEKDAREDGKKKIVTIVDEASSEMHAFYLVALVVTIGVGLISIFGSI